jgi:NAD(P)-dependent dehydrogenase (short-subunit alcohol dehydrogenase family)
VKTAFVQLELDDQKSVRQAVGETKQLYVETDGLINNAAVMACPYSKTAGGIEMQFGTNHIGHVLITHLSELSDIDSHNRERF